MSRGIREWLAMTCAFAVVLDVPTASRAADQPWSDAGEAPALRAQQLLAAMTLDEKLAMVHGGGAGGAGDIAGNTRLGIPDLVMSDGALGLANFQSGATQFPDGANSAATWDPALMRTYGSALGNEFFNKGSNVLLGPAVDTVRTPLSGRAYETLGEDPLLTRALTVPSIRGIQSQNVLATVKHFAAHTEEANVYINSRVSDQALHEIYLPAFEGAIKDADAGAVMCAYNGVNGNYSCESPSLLTKILRDTWGFNGFVMSDWGATQSTAKAANAGLDVEMPLASFFGTPLKDALASGQVPVARLDQMVTNILTSTFQHGLFDHPAPSMNSQRATVVSTPDHQALTTQISQSGSVLLKNDNHTLPLPDAAGKKLAVIGYAGDAGATYAGVGSPNVSPTGTPISPLQGITARATQAQVSYTNGPGGPLPVLAAAKVTPVEGTGQGFTGTYYSTRNFTGTPLAVRNDPTLDFGIGQLGEYSLPVQGALSVRWQGKLSVPVTGTYHFSLDDEGSAQFYVNGTKVIDATAGSQGASGVGAIDLVAGQPVSIQIDYLPFYVPSFNVLFSHIRLGGQTPDDPDAITVAAQAAARADVAVVFVNDKTSEGTDRTSLTLPGDQDGLVSAVAAANPNTVVVLNTSSAVTMPWLPAVRSVMEVWYPGQMYGTALASLLFGDVNPSGKLPVTFPADETQGPWRAGSQQYPGDGSNVDYSEGILEGYRWYDAKGQKPQFAFGHGLSYTSFGFSNLSLAPKLDGTVDVSFDLTNTGTRRGTDVAQVYVGAGPDHPGVQQAVRSLRGFDRVTLDPGQTKRETITLDARSFQYWDTTTQQWLTNYGPRRIWVGDSSALANLPLSATTTPVPAGSGASGGVAGTVPATLSLTLGAPATFGAFTPGVANDYFASTTANVISTAGDATLSVADPSAANTGHLVNGTFALPQVLQARGNAGTYAPVGGSSSPTPLLTYGGPVSNDSVTVAFKQSIGSSDALRTGAYSKTLTFTLSTTTP